MIGDFLKGRGGDIKLDPISEMEQLHSSLLIAKLTATQRSWEVKMAAVQLPGMDGLSATQIIKEDPSLKEIPIVALTSYAMQGDEEKALEAGCSGYIAKPIDTRKFLETISQYLKDNNC